MGFRIRATMSLGQQKMGSCRISSQRCSPSAFFNDYKSDVSISLSSFDEGHATINHPSLNCLALQCQFDFNVVRSTVEILALSVTPSFISVIVVIIKELRASLPRIISLSSDSEVAYSLGRCSVIMPTGCFNCDSDEEMELPLDIYGHDGKLISYVDYSHELLHESAAKIFLALQSHESAKNLPKLSKAWIGVDVDSCLRRTAYQAAAYGFLKAVVDMVSMFDDGHLVRMSLSSNLSLIMECIGGQLRNRDPELVKWFRMEKVPVLNRYFTPSVERWASEYTKRRISNDLGMILLVINSCAAVRKLGAQRISCPAFYMSLADTVWELFESSRGLGSIGISYQFATMDGHETEFLSIFGQKVLHHNAEEEILFWMKLLQEKLVSAFVREGFLSKLKCFFNSKVLARDLAIVGLFAFLGRKTRLFLLQMGVKDLDETLKDFICYLECGILFVYPNLSSLCVYQLFMEVVTEEIDWLDLYSEVPCIRRQDRRRSKQCPRQAEKEIILSAVFSVCSDIFSNFALYCEKIEQSPNADVVAFLNGSKNLLNICLEDYWAAYDKICFHVHPSETVGPLTNPWAVSTSLSLRDLPVKPADLAVKGIFEPPSCPDKLHDTFPESVGIYPPQSMFAKYSDCVLSTISDVCMGIQLLFIDLSITFILTRKLLCGRKLTRKERKKIFRTFIDIICIIPVAILMLLPVTAIGHAVILAAIKKHMPNLIPSAFSAQRLDVVKQLTRAKKMKVQSSCGHAAEIVHN
ncbi:hypothetical protein J5N97_004451 [Dioscorea zingiberensis]|uniref:LETM1-like protein n=1 Tax=Dioscorea zingiberensis TaxID=325984 RepID=A0A9D5D8K0_9LILI|nr:hypothetical protein J5N97_004451 [Dioscorea zingiberensis]